MRMHDVTRLQSEIPVTTVAKSVRAAQSPQCFVPLLSFLVSFLVVASVMGCGARREVALQPAGTRSSTGQTKPTEAGQDPNPQNPSAPGKTPEQKPGSGGIDESDPNSSSDPVATVAPVGSARLICVDEKGEVGF